MTGIPVCVWDFLSGRDPEGVPYRVHRLIDSSGRVLAKVVEPNGHAYDFQAYFHLEKAMDEEDLRFIDAESGKRFVIEKLADRAAKLAAGAGEKKDATELATAKSPA